jgi:hypothetical protein
MKRVESFFMELKILDAEIIEKEKRVAVLEERKMRLISDFYDAVEKIESKKEGNNGKNKVDDFLVEHSGRNSNNNLGAEREK